MLLCVCVRACLCVCMCVRVWSKYPQKDSVKPDIFDILGTALNIFFFFLLNRKERKEMGVLGLLVCLVYLELLWVYSSNIYSRYKT